MYRFSGKDGVTKQRSNTLKVVHLGFCKKWKVQSMRYEQNRIPSLLNSIANGHVHTLPPCCDLFQSMPSPWPTESIYSQRVISLNQHYLLHLTNKYWCTILSLWYLLYSGSKRKHIGTVLPYIFQSSIILPRAPRPHYIFMSCRFSNNILPRQRK